MDVTKLVVWLIGSGAVISTVGIILVTMTDHPVPHSLIAQVSFCYGALASFLVGPSYVPPVLDKPKSAEPPSAPAGGHG